MQVMEVRVWDPLVRAVHWVLAAAVIVDWFTDEPLWMHMWLGYLALALVVLRIVWASSAPSTPVS
jgi:cytochrome b